MPVAAALRRVRLLQDVLSRASAPMRAVAVFGGCAMNVWERWTMPDRIERFVAAMDVQPGDRVLEIGCGHGLAATLVCARLVAGRYVAADRSAKMIAAATRRNADFVASGVATFIHAPLETLDLGEARFDKVFAMRVRLFHDEPAQAGELAARWLAPGGRLFVEYDQPGQAG
jgi:ubiquinone/menaquinone biosynthesis C-methylase UbiE